jgi:hypothetical protein
VNGKTVIINVDNKTLPDSRIRVLFDGSEIATANSYADVLDPTNENVPEYLLVSSENGVQVIVSIPHFSSHTITISNLPLSSLTTTIIFSIIVIFVSVIISWKWLLTKKTIFLTIVTVLLMLCEWM